MRPLVLVLLVLTALHAPSGCMIDGGGPDNDRPIIPSVVPTTTSTTTPMVIRGRVCRLIDLRDVTLCEIVDVGDLTVEVGGVVTTTQADGTFVAAVSPSTSSVAVLGATVAPTLSPLPGSTANPFVPVVDADIFARMFTSNGLRQSPTSGSVLAFVTRAGSPASGVVASTTPSAVVGPFFDGPFVDVWTLDATGVRGAIWAPGLIPGRTAITIANPDGTGATTLDPVQVVEGGITIVNGVL